MHLPKFSIALPNKTNRFLPKLEKLQKTNPKATYADVLKPKQIEIRNRKSNVRLDFEQVDKFIRKKIGELNMTQDHYNAYLAHVRDKLTDIFEHNHLEKEKHQIRKNRVEADRKDFIAQNTGKERDNEEEKYTKRKNKDTKTRWTTTKPKLRSLMKVKS